MKNKFLNLFLFSIFCTGIQKCTIYIGLHCKNNNYKEYKHSLKKMSIIGQK